MQILSRSGWNLRSAFEQAPTCCSRCCSKAKGLEENLQLMKKMVKEGNMSISALVLNGDAEKEAPLDILKPLNDHIFVYS